jgi:hypothetical protein
MNDFEPVFWDRIYIPRTSSGDMSERDDEKKYDSDSERKTLDIGVRNKPP